jgi:hypothetical protein
LAKKGLWQYPVQAMIVDNAVFIALVVDSREFLRYDNEINRKSTIYQE